MVTREDLKNYRHGIRELRMLRASIRQAELNARAGRGTVTEPGETSKRVQKYAAMEKRLTAEQGRIEAAIASLKNPRYRQVLHCRYILGWSLTRTAAEMYVCEKTVQRDTAKAIAVLTRERFLAEDKPRLRQYRPE